MTTNRDYRRARAPRQSAPFSGWTGLFFGLLIGGVMAFYGYQKGKQAPVAEPPRQDKVPASARAAVETPEAEDVPPTDTVDYTFYERLKGSNVVLPERDQEAKRDLSPAPETRPGTYVLQAGSFPKRADAETVRAKLALQGIESSIQVVTVDSETWHRVRIGPVNDLAQVNRLRGLLRNAKMNVIVIRAGD